MLSNPNFLIALSKKNVNAPYDKTVDERIKSNPLALIDVIFPVFKIKKYKCSSR